MTDKEKIHELWEKIGKGMSSVEFDEYLESAVNRASTDLEDKGIENFSTYITVMMHRIDLDKGLTGVINIENMPKDEQDQHAMFAVMGRSIAELGSIPVAAFWTQRGTLARKPKVGEPSYDDAVVTIGMTNDFRINTGIIRLEDGSPKYLTMFKYTELDEGEQLDCDTLTHLFRGAKNYLLDQEDNGDAIDDVADQLFKG